MSPNSIAARIACDPCASYWLRDSVKALLQRDPVDAVNDAEALALAMRDHLKIIQGGR
jgi:hypothetical protein